MNMYMYKCVLPTRGSGNGHQARPARNDIVIQMNSFDSPGVSRLVHYRTFHSFHDDPPGRDGVRLIQKRRHDAIEAILRVQMLGVNGVHCIERDLQEDSELERAVGDREEVVDDVGQVVRSQRLFFCGVS